ncbi:MAG TPA: class I SAM-dependent methyltransferase, partial [Planctomycetaceae bacterium]|nr:class I SAM-dependent methyltransferase [Planctomycetaceae bacterium]
MPDKSFARTVLRNNALKATRNCRMNSLLKSLRLPGANRRFRHRNWIAAVGLALFLPLAPPSVSTAEGGAPTEEAAEILDAAGVTGGLIVHVGCGDGRLTLALHDAVRSLVHGLETDEGLVRKAREHIQAAGLYGPVSVELWSGGRLPYAENLVNLAVVESPRRVTDAEVMRVLVPGGVALIRQNDGWKKLVKQRSGELGQWTHFLHGPDNNAVAHDRRVGPPRRLQWLAAPRFARSHEHLASVSVVVSAGGRLFAIVDEGPTESVLLPSKWRLVARDAFNGVLLWKRSIRRWESRLRG